VTPEAQRIIVLRESRRLANFVRLWRWRMARLIREDLHELIAALRSANGGRQNTVDKRTRNR